jgi:hypothetical protein
MMSSRRSPRSYLDTNARYLFLDEAEAFYGRGQSLLIYQHFARQERGDFVQRKAAALQELAPGEAVYAFRTSHVVFLLVIHPESPPSIAAAAEHAASAWPDGFIRGERIAG